ncbi:hypothetical protein GCM10011360_06510 [Primorskyibacter flagellatus]|uniref:Uncharacterized protein n=1 Tax=Primorskyibacter flagellatus TaxID=1387277 RepID=A0A917EB04_9RHOB|nr:hypothetical protein [Primorskyibacter flagellatus]GGE20542.1 hypothetical protein GCM10011360_06510 [Primorskyibacter flagellatus]
MGGSGSGRYAGYSSRSTTDDYRKIDVRRWAREGFLEPGQHFAWKWSVREETVASIRAISERGAVRLIYRTRQGGDDWHDMDYRVRLDWTPCNFGNSRDWFLCPSAGCERRVAVLFGGSVFACRTCHRLSYASQREDALSRMLRKSRKLETRLGWDDFYGRKPKGMHWRTFATLVEQHDMSEIAQAQEFHRRFGLSGTLGKGFP